MKVFNRRKNSINLIISILLSFAVAILIPTIVYGTSFNSDSIEISGSHRIKNEEGIITGRHTFILTASNDAPMPNGAKGGTKKVTINSNEDFSFGKIEYDAPGIYDYTVSRKLVKSENLIQDNSVYYCHVEVMRDGTAVVVFEKQDTEGKPNRIEYTDTYVKSDDKTKPEDKKDKDDSGGNKKKDTDTNKKSRGDPINTGDGQDTKYYLIVLSVSLIITTILVIGRYRRYKKE